MKKVLFNIFALFFAFFLPLTAVNASAVDELKHFSATTKTARGSFSQAQVKNGNKIRFTHAASGTFVFSRPGKFVWKYQKPYTQVIQSDGKKLYLYDKDLNQVTIKSLGSAIGSSPAAILFGSNNLEKNFALRNTGSHHSMNWVEVIPRSHDTPFQKITIGMSNGVPRAMELYDAMGQLTLVRFTQFTRNPSVGASNFVFHMPKGADVYGK